MLHGPHDTTLVVGELCDPMCPKCSFVKKKQTPAKEMNGLGGAKSEEMHWYRTWMNHPGELHGLTESTGVGEPMVTSWTFRRDVLATSSALLYYTSQSPPSISVGASTLPNLCTYPSTCCTAHRVCFLVLCSFFSCGELRNVEALRFVFGYPRADGNACEWTVRGLSVLLACREELRLGGYHLRRTMASMRQAHSPLEHNFHLSPPRTHDKVYSENIRARLLFL